jgi:hypothetical protein
MLPLILWRVPVPVECARRARVFWTGEVFRGALTIRGREGDGAVKLVLRGRRSLLVLRSLGNERWVSSTVDAGEAEREESMKDMETVRLFDGRKVADDSREGVEEQSV